MRHERRLAANVCGCRKQIRTNEKNALTADPNARLAGGAVPSCRIWYDMLYVPPREKRGKRMIWQVECLFHRTPTDTPRCTEVLMVRLLYLSDSALRPPVVRCRCCCCFVELPGTWNARGEWADRATLSQNQRHPYTFTFFILPNRGV